MRCAQCGASLGEDHRFCGDCGAPVGGCPSCGEPLTPGKRFCHACGYALSDAADILWAWPLAARIAHDLRDTATIGELLGFLESHPEGHIPLMLLAERDLVRARLADSSGEHAAGAALTSAISSLRTMSSPYHLAHGLLDHAGYLMKQGDADAAAAAITEARGIASRLRCEPLLDRAEAIEPAEPRMRADR